MHLYLLFVGGGWGRGGGGGRRGKKAESSNYDLQDYVILGPDFASPFCYFLWNKRHK